MRLAMLKGSSIRFRLTAWYALSLAVVLGLVAVASYFAMRASMYRAVDVDLRFRLAGLEEFLKAQTISDINQLPGEIGKRNTFGVLFEIFDENGSVVYRSDVLTSHDARPKAPNVPKGTIVFRDVGHRDWLVRMAAQRVQVDGHTVIVEAAQPIRFHYASLRSFAASISFALPVLVVVVALAGYWLSGRALAPVDRIVREARAICPDRLSARLSVPQPNDELRRLSETLNSMLDRIEQSVTRTRQFTADASHELRGPLTLIQTAAEFSLRRKRSQDELVEALEKILRESKSSSLLIDDLLLLARADSEEGVLTLGCVNLNSSVRETVERIGALAAEKNIQLATDISEVAIDVLGDGNLLQRLLFILIENAIKYTPEGGSVKVSLHEVGLQAVLAVTDTGIGISPDDLPHIFDRFWRVDKVRSRSAGGTGLGLSIAKWIVEKNYGTLAVESIIGQGSRFEVRLPMIATANRDLSADQTHEM